MKSPPLTVIGLVLLALAIAALPFVATNYLLRLTTIGFMYVALASSWNIIGGFTGYPGGAERSHGQGDEFFFRCA